MTTSAVDDQRVALDRIQANHLRIARKQEAALKSEAEAKKAKQSAEKVAEKAAKAAEKAEE